MATRFGDMTQQLQSAKMDLTELKQLEVKMRILSQYKDNAAPLFQLAGMFGMCVERLTFREWFNSSNHGFNDGHTYAIAYTKLPISEYSQEHVKFMVYDGDSDSFYLPGSIQEPIKVHDREDRVDHSPIMNTTARIYCVSGTNGYTSNPYDIISRLMGV